MKFRNTDRIIDEMKKQKGDVMTGKRETSMTAKAVETGAAEANTESAETAVTIEEEERETSVTAETKDSEAEKAAGSATGEDTGEETPKTGWISKKKNMIKEKKTKKENGSKGSGGKAGAGKKKRKKKKFIVIGAIFLALILALVLFGKVFSGGNDDAGVPETTALEIMDIKQTVDVKGVVEGSDSAEVSSSLNYKIVKINVKEGDLVKKGDVLAVLDSSELARSYDLAVSQYESAKYALDNTIEETQNSYDSDMREMKEAKRLLDANKKLYDAGAISYSDYIGYENDYKSKAAKVSTYTVSGGRVTASVSQRQSLESERITMEMRRAELEEVNITSPISGTVTRVNAMLGRYPGQNDSSGGSSAATGMFLVENLDALKMEVKISEYDIKSIELGQKVTLSSEVLGENNHVKGKIVNISPTGEQKDTTSTEMVIPVVISIDNSDHELIAGVSAKGKILIAEAKDALGAPVESVREDDKGNCSVFVMRDGAPVEVSVKIGIRGNFFVEIISDDLKEGDLILTNPDNETIAALPGGTDEGAAE